MMETLARRIRPWVAVALLFTVALLATACVGSAPQSTLSPSGPNAGSVSRIYWLVIVATGAIFVVVEGLLIYAIFRFRRRAGQSRPTPVHGNTKLEIAWTLAPAIVLLVIAIPTFITMARLSRTAASGDRLRVTVVGHQWWWEFRYDDLDVVTANEMHIPVGVPVQLTLQSADVIHSFWVPKLAGKLDVIPNRVNVMHDFRADVAGVYQGQCAEFCGEAHANMQLRVVAESQEEFDTWVRGMRSASPAPVGLAKEGADLFTAKGCSSCHAVRGTGAAGTFGPDLTQFGTRSTLAAGVAENTTADLYRWLRDPQDVKPGAKMPTLRLSDKEAIRLVAYLQSLKPDLSQPIAEQPGGTVTPPPTVAVDPESGKRLFVSKGCTACHAIQGLPGATGVIGPDLTHVASQATIVGGKLKLDEASLRAWLKDPPSLKPGTLMPNLRLSDSEVAALVAYLMSLK